MAFEKELETYRRALPDWIDQEGRWTLILGDEIGGVFDSREEATDQGYEKFGLAQFLVKQIHQIEPIYFMGGALIRI